MPRPRPAALGQAPPRWPRGGACGTSCRPWEVAALTSQQPAGRGRGRGAGPGSGAGPARRDRREPGQRRRYGLLLAVLIASYLISALVGGRASPLTEVIGDTQLALFAVAGLLALRVSPPRRRPVRTVAAAILVASAIGTVIGVHLGGDAGRGAASVWTAALLLVTVTLLVRQILSHPSVTVQSIYGAISAYLLIGLMFAACYSAMYFLHGRSFFSGGQRGTASAFQYFSFTTLTTLGYGDFTAATSLGRAVAMLEAMTGQIFLATLVAKLVASFRPRPRGDGASRDG